MDTPCWDYTSPGSEVSPPLWRKDAPLTWAMFHHSCWCRSRCDIPPWHDRTWLLSLQGHVLFERLRWRVAIFLPIILKCHIIKPVHKWWEEETHNLWATELLTESFFLFSALTFLLVLNKPVHCFRIQYFARRLSTPPVYAWLRAAQASARHWTFCTDWEIQCSVFLKLCNSLNICPA